jgi:hypothetical protein
MMSGTREFWEISEENAGPWPVAVSLARHGCRIGVTPKTAVEFATGRRLRSRPETARGGGVLPVGAEGRKGAATQTGTLRYCLAWHML